VKREFKLILALNLYIFLTGCQKTPTSVEETKRDVPWKVFTQSNSALVDNHINSLYVDGMKNLWIGTNKGANRLFRDSWEKIEKDLDYATSAGLSRKVNAITVGKDGSVWFGLAGGGIRRRSHATSGRIWVEYKSPTLTSDMIYSLQTDNMGDIWVGTANGVSRCVPGTVESNTARWYKYTSENSLVPDEPIKCVGVNPTDNTIWFGTYSWGVVSYDVDLDWNISAPSDFPSPIVSMGFTYGNTIWFGTYSDWAYKYNVATTEWIQYTDSAHGGGLPDYFVNAIAINKNGDIWFGTNRGITKMKGTSWKTWDTSNSSLPNNIITSLVFDKSENLWIGTANGLAEFNEKGIVE